MVDDRAMEWESEGSSQNHLFMVETKAVNIKNAWKSNSHEKIKPTLGRRTTRDRLWGPPRTMVPTTD